MAHLYRLVLACLFVLASSPASAVINPDQKWCLYGSNGTAECSNKAGTQSSYTAFINAHPTAVNCGGVKQPFTPYVFRDEPAYYGWNFYWNGCPGATGGPFYNGSESLKRAYEPWGAPSLCPVNSTLSGSTCVCNSGYIEQGGSCVVAPPPNNCSSLAGVSAGSYSGVGITGEKQLCDTVDKSSGDPAKPGCYLRGYAEFAASYGSPPAYHWTAKMSYTGDKCAADPNGSTDFGGTPSATPSTSSSSNVDNGPTTCPIGKVPGTVNGVTVCVDPGPTTPTNTSTTGTSSTTNPDGSTVQKTDNVSTQCTGDACTKTVVTNTTTTVNNVSTTTTSTTTSTCSRLDPSCSAPSGSSGGADGDGSSFGGNCMASFNCSGDAIMCSVALEQHRRNCALFVDSTAESQLYDSEKTKTGTRYDNTNQALSTGTFNSSNALGVSASCISDRTVMVAGTSIVLPFSGICPSLQHFGTILIFVSFLVAYRIVARG